MTKKKFFRCFSINLHSFLKASGLRPMNKGEHTSGINALNVETGEFHSFATLGQAVDTLGLEFADLQRIHKTVEQMEKGGSYTASGYEFKPRVRVFWVYSRDEQFEKALYQWNKTKPSV